MRHGLEPVYKLCPNIPSDLDVVGRVASYRDYSVIEVFLSPMLPYSDTDACRHREDLPNSISTPQTRGQAATSLPEAPLDEQVSDGTRHFTALYNLRHEHRRARIVNYRLWGTCVRGMHNIPMIVSMI